MHGFLPSTKSTGLGYGRFQQRSMLYLLYRDGFTRGGPSRPLRRANNSTGYRASDVRGVVWPNVRHRLGQRHRYHLDLLKQVRFTILARDLQGKSGLRFGGSVLDWQSRDALTKTS